MDFCWRSLFSKASTEKAKGDLGRDLGDEWQKLHWHGNSVDFAMLTELRGFDPSAINLSDVSY